MFQRKHFELVAQVLRAQKPKGDFYPEWSAIVNHFCIQFHSLNAKFDEAKFKTACGHPVD